MRLDTENQKLKSLVPSALTINGGSSSIKFALFEFGKKLEHSFFNGGDEPHSHAAFADAKCRPVIHVCDVD